MVEDQSTIPTKTCTKCGETKPTTEFHFANKTRQILHALCKPCSNAKCRAYYAANKEQFSTYNAAYYLDNRPHLMVKKKRDYAATAEERRAEKRAWRAANPEQLKANQLRYRAKNPDKVRARNNQRKARLRGVSRNDFTPAQWRAMLVICNDRCCYCDRQMERLTMEHLTPLVAGGPHTLWNILPACLACNLKKQDGPVLKPVQPFLLL